jgi:hypothetical protein
MTEFPAYQAPPQFQPGGRFAADRLRTRSIVVAILVAVAALGNSAATAILAIRGPSTGSESTTPDLVMLPALLYLTAGIAFVTWQHRARANLDSFGVRGLKWSPGWTVGGWLLPVANLVIPIQVLNEIDKASAKVAAGTEWGAESREASDGGRRIVSLWGVFWVLDFVFGTVPAFLSGSVLVTVDILAVVSELGAGLLAILLVLRITANQESASRNRSAQPSFAPPAAGPNAAGLPLATSPLAAWPESGA